MANSATRSTESPRPRDRARAQQDIQLCWASLRAAGSYVQLLDDRVSNYSDWARRFDSLEQLLAATAGRLQSWDGSPYPAEHAAVEAARVNVASCLLHCQHAMHAFSWDKAQAWIYLAGQSLLSVAALLGVEL